MQKCEKTHIVLFLIIEGKTVSVPHHYCKKKEKEKKKANKKKKKLY
jgi:hypothetical protein